jgi:hypothetical protein
MLDLILGHGLTPEPPREPLGGVPRIIAGGVGLDECGTVQKFLLALGFWAQSNAADIDVATLSIVEPIVPKPLT